MINKIFIIYYYLLFIYYYYFTKIKMSFISKIFYIFTFSLFITLLSPTSQLSCNKVANYPNDFNNLIPNYQLLPKVHSFNYFFLTDYDEIPTMTMKINIPQLSILKLQIIPIHSRININLTFKNGESTIKEENFFAISGIPFDYNRIY